MYGKQIRYHLTRSGFYRLSLQNTYREVVGRQYRPETFRDISNQYLHASHLRMILQILLLPLYSRYMRLLQASESIITRPL